ncbi:hypothetical protein CAC42_5574 [Sphaceloma murrayae]|uniref:Uncharacterized protein n=1 Tax=Sphaceloma murrayae TaxID=2082308 RepID=A0A2K1QYJ0_9PEZI|nr:hypothetical protein CAC42_5574 [Sphaceloma murrayae]
MPKAGEQDAPWTASRCLRLLRPITSRIEPLQKLVAARPLLVSSENNRNIVPEAKVTAPQESPLSRRDPSWLPNRPKRVIRDYSSRSRARFRLAQSNPSDSQKTNALPAGPCLPTPYKVRRTSVLKADSDEDDYDRYDPPATDRDDTDSSFRAAPVLKQKTYVASCSTPKTQKRANLERGIIDGLGALLERTKPAPTPSSLHVDSSFSISDEENISISSQQGRAQLTPPPRRAAKSTAARYGALSFVHGTSSLFDTCLRQIPVLIEAEQALDLGDDAGDLMDVASELYMEVESLGAGGLFYTPLKLVVRAHGLRLAMGCFQDGLFSESARERLLEKILHFGTRSEVLHAMETRTSFAGPIKHVLGDHEYPCVTRDQAVNNNSLRTMSEWDLPVIYVARLLQSGGLCLPTFVTLPWKVWLMKTPGWFARERTGESLQGLEVFLSLACGVPERRADGTTIWDTNGLSVDSATQKFSDVFATLLITLTAMAVAGLRVESDAGKRAAAEAITVSFKMIAMDILTDLKHRHFTASSPGGGSAWKILATKLLTALLVLQSHGSDTRSTLPIEAVVDAMHKTWFPKQDWVARKARLQHAVDMMHSIATCVSDGDRDQAADVLHDCVRPLMDAAYGCDALAAEFLRELGVESTRRFAKMVGSKKARRIARDIDEECQALGERFEGDGSEQLAAGQDSIASYEWDEWLREWIVRPSKASEAQPSGKAGGNRSHPRSTTGIMTVRVVDGPGPGPDTSTVGFETPRRDRHAAMDIDSPDELGPQWARFDQQRRNVAAAPPYPVRQAQAPQTPTALADLVDRDELALSVRRPAAETVYGARTGRVARWADDDDDDVDMVDELG